MDEVAEAATDAALARIEPTAGFAEVRDGAEFAVYGPRGVPPVVELLAGFLGGLLVLEARIDVTDQVCGDIVSTFLPHLKL